MPMWTPQQQQAISARNHTILVSAAAGSGKTAVLVERIVQLIREGWRIDRMLIVTFTKAAASEMRQRLNKRLVKEAAADSEVMGRALDDLESTEISTIHAFCQKVLRNHFEAVGIDPMVRACDDQMKTALFDEAWLDALNELLDEHNDPDFMDLAYSWEQQRLHDMTAALYDFLMSLPSPFDWLDRAITQVRCGQLELHPWYRVLIRHARLELEGIGDILQGMKNMLEEPDSVSIRQETWQADMEAYRGLFHVDWEDAQSILSALDEFVLVKAKAARNTSDAQKEWLARFKKQRDRIAAIIKETRVRLTINEDKLQHELHVMQSQLRGLSVLAKRTHQLFLSKKEAQHVIDFSDMEQFTMDILSQSAYRTALQAEYDHIFVDECQDVSQIQDAILQSIHGPNNFMFMVGDVKQSIYRFRKADPTLFLHRMRTFSDDEDAQTRRIFLQKNFRSRANVLEATNQVFRTVMRPDVTELTYEPKDELICGRETVDDPAVEMHLLDESAGDDGEKVEALRLEAQVVIQRIREMLNEQFDDGSGMRHYTYRDMVILLSAASNTAPKLVEMLNQAGIPVFYDGAAAYFSLPEIQAIKSLLCVIDNPMQDIPLLSVLKMPPFSLTDTQLGEIRQCKTGKSVPFYEAFETCCEGDQPLNRRCGEIREQLRTWRFESEIMRLSDFMWHVIRDSGYYAACGALPKGELRQANLRMLYQRALAFEQGGGSTLADFLRLTDQQSSGDDRMSAKMLGEGENLVRIMTMHKSKGLEFPVVFCMQMSGKLHRAYRGDLLMHTSLGVAMPYVNRELSIRRKTIADEAFKIQRELDEKAERARLLYVAMTRARERLILIGCSKGNERDVWHMPESDYRIWTAKSMTDWLMQGMLTANIHNLSTTFPQDGTPWNVRCWSHVEMDAVDNPVDKVGTDHQLQELLRTKPECDLSHWDSLYQQAVSVPLKTSVTAIAKKQVTKDPMPVAMDEEDAEDKRRPEEIISPLRMSELPSRPTFMEERQLTGAERGTLIHRVLSLMPLSLMRGASRLSDAVQRAVHDMVEREILRSEELFTLNMQGLVRFYGSDIGQRMLRSRQVRREWSFNLRMEDNATLLQGVIDCAFREDDGWVLLDYKTDHIQDEAAFQERYAMQLEWYARALERITGVPVKEMWLYALSIGKAYRMERQG
ncbi:MAG: helicase-exonuclease AddAB subunit AddA [Clostridia bacterium]|nr:helicase-exonuclease AddAB subunit AddA [Clostridia bacterium]